MYTSLISRDHGIMTNIVFNIDACVNHVCMRVLPIRRTVDVCSSVIDTLITADTSKAPGRNVLLSVDGIFLGIEEAIGFDDCNLVKINVHISSIRHSTG